MPAQPLHRVSISVAGQRIDGWNEYEIESSLTEVVDRATLKRPFDSDAYRICTPDAEVKIKIDDTTVISGFIDDREKDTDKGTSTMSLVVRDKAGRLVNESAPTIAYDGLDLVEVTRRLASPWFTKVSTSDARNRIVRLGRKGRKAAAGDEALVVKVKKKTWQHEPGQMRMKIIQDLCNEAQYLVWSSADGEELIIGKPNYKQEVQFLIANPGSGAPVDATAIKLNFKESVADRYSLIMAIGSGRGDIANYGESTVSRRDIVKNGPGIDGTGVDFDHPKRLILAERTLLDVAEARQYAQLNMDRRDFHKQIVTATMPSHGQISAGSNPTLYAPNTVGRVIDGEQDPPVDGVFMIYQCRYSCSKEGGESTGLSLVPRGTVFAQ